MLHKITLS